MPLNIRLVTVKEHWAQGGQEVDKGA